MAKHCSFFYCPRSSHHSIVILLLKREASNTLRRAFH